MHGNWLPASGRLSTNKTYIILHITGNYVRMYLCMSPRTGFWEREREREERERREKREREQGQGSAKSLPPNPSPSVPLNIDNSCCGHVLNFFQDDMWCYLSAGTMNSQGRVEVRHQFWTEKDIFGRQERTWSTSTSVGRGISGKRRRANTCARPRDLNLKSRAEAAPYIWKRAQGGNNWIRATINIIIMYHDKLKNYSNE